MARVLATDVAFDSIEERNEFLKDFKDREIEAVWRREMEWEDYYVDD